MRTLIIKLGASGDVVRTTTLLHLFDEVDWITSDLNSILLKGAPNVNRIITESQIKNTNFDGYDLVINLEDTFDAANLLKKIKFKELFGAYLSNQEKIEYTDSSSKWFDLSLISKFGIEKANKLKYQNQKSFQELVFDGLGFKFNSESYFLPNRVESDLSGDICVAPKAGRVWPMKNWAFYEQLVEYLRKNGFIVNYLPHRHSLIEHLSDIQNHKLLISGDSLPMHFALGAEMKLITLFICTSPSEIFDYNRMKKIVSTEIEKYWYRRDFDQRAVESISLKNVIDGIESILKK